MTDNAPTTTPTTPPSIGMAPKTTRKGRVFRRRLAFRFALWLCLGTAAILLVAGYWNIQQQREHMTELVRAAGNRCSETMLRSTHHAMMEAQRDRIQNILQSIGRQDGVERVRIFDKKGEIYSSDLVSEVGTLVPMSDERCTICHVKGEPPAQSTSHLRFRQFEREGRSILGVTRAILNEQRCSSASCHFHSPDEGVLGILDVQMSLEPVNEHVAASQQALVIGLVLLAGAVTALAGFLTWRMVILPVRRFREASARVAAGDLTAKLPVESSDEIGEMTASWNRMLDELRRTREDLQDWSRTLEDRVRAKTDELEVAHQRMLVVEKMASLGKLAAVVAHEINNPLAGISTYARVLRKKSEKAAGAGGPDPKTMEILDLIAREAQRCGEIVRNLLLFSRSTGARFAVEDLGALLERCRLLVNHKAELQDVEIGLDVASTLPEVECDASQIQQLVVALAVNAIEAMDEGGSLTLATVLAADGKAVVLTFRDTGTGILPEIRDHIFEPFFTTKAEGKGVGLGLAVVYGIVARHHGQISVDSEMGEGTVFTVTLPVGQPKDTSAASEAPGAAEASGASGASGTSGTSGTDQPSSDQPASEDQGVT